MPFLSDTDLDALLARLDTDANEIHLCSQEPTTYAEATSTYSLGKASISIPSAADRVASGLGRRVTVPATSGNTVDANGTASHYAIVNTAGSALIATNDLDATLALTTADTWSSPAFDIGVKDAVSA